MRGLLCRKFFKSGSTQLTTEKKRGYRQQRVSAIAGDEQVESFLLSITFVAEDSDEQLNPQHQKPAKRWR